VRISHPSRWNLGNSIVVHPQPSHSRLPMHGAVVVGVVGSCKSLSLGFSHKELNNMWFCFSASCCCKLQPSCDGLVYLLFVHVIRLRCLYHGCHIEKVWRFETSKFFGPNQIFSL
jgi:hypothetical protein